MIAKRWLVICLMGCLSGCRDGVGERAIKPRDSSRNVLRLDAADRQRLGIVIVPARREAIEVTKSAVGWLEVPPAAQTVVRSPVNGFIEVKEGVDWPLLGQAVQANSELANVNIYLTPQEVSQLVNAKEENDIQMQQAFVTMELSESQLKLVTDAKEAVAGTRIAQLQEALAHAKTAYKEARDKLPFLIQEPYDNGLLVKPVSVASSVFGRVIQVHVTPGQFVAIGDPLWTIVDWSKLWIRVPLFEKDAKRIDRTTTAFVTDSSTGQRTYVNAVDVPVETKPLTRTVDFLFAIENGDWNLHVGQSVVVEFPLGAKHAAILIPSSALLFNDFGRASCFVVNGADEFVRKRVELGDRKDEFVEVVRGIEAGDNVVAIGAQQLAADESKADLAVEDDGG